MKPKTTNLGLNLTTDTKIGVIEWRNSIDGVGSKEKNNLSNMQIIDEVVGDILHTLDIVNGDA